MTEDNKRNTEESTASKEAALADIPLHSLDAKQLIELDACTRCGECLTWCPVYDQDANESVIPRRKVIDFLRIAKSQQGFLAKILRNEKVSPGLKGMLGRVFRYREIGREEIDDFVRNLYECSTCGQCEVVCPAHIETVALWEELRRVIVQAGYGPLEAQKALVKSVKAFDNPWQQPRAARTKWARKAKKDGLIREMPREIRKTGGKVLLFFGCTAAYDVNVKQVAINTINILEALDIDYGILGSEEKCCASVLLRMGDPEHERVFQENIDLFNSLGIDTLISSCSGCFKTIMQDYPRISPLHFEVLHTVEYLARLLKEGKLHFPHPVERTVTYHDPCHLGRAAAGFDAPRMIMEAIPGLRLVEMPRNREYSRCCGAGGGLKAGYPDLQNKMAQRRVREAEDTGADSLVSCCPFCYQGLNVGITALESQLVMRDISALVAESLLGYDVFEKAAREAEAKGRAARKPQTETPKTDASPAVDTARSDPAGKKAERERKRAERRAARGRSAEAGIENPPESAAPPPAETGGSDRKAERERRRAERRAARKESPPVEAPAAEGPTAGPAGDAEGGTDKKADRKRRRAERRGQRSAAPEAASPAEERPAEPAAEPEPTAAPEPAPSGSTSPDTGAEDAKAAKKAERERRRAARRAGRS